MTLIFHGHGTHLNESSDDTAFNESFIPSVERYQEQAMSDDEVSADYRRRRLRKRHDGSCAGPGAIAVDAARGASTGGGRTPSVPYNAAEFQRLRAGTRR